MNRKIVVSLLILMLVIDASYAQKAIPKPQLQKRSSSIATTTKHSSSSTATTSIASKSSTTTPSSGLSSETSLTSSQTAESSTENEKIYDVAEVMPEFPGGQSALFKFLSANVSYPELAMKNGIQGRVIVSFVVERDGSITNAQVMKSVDPSLDREALRLVRSMPAWSPGKQKGVAVRVKYTIPVTFKLQ